MGVIYLMIGVLMSGIYGFGLGPVNRRCKSMAELELFNACFAGVAMIGAMVSALTSGSMAIPFTGLLISLFWGTFFSLCVFFNLAALEEGPLSLTWLIVNFSLIMPLIYSFGFLGEPVTLLRVVGIVLLVICMLLFTNPKVTGEKKISGKWLFYTLASMFCNGGLSLVAKIYAMKTDNVYASPFLAYSYMFAAIVSLLISLILRSRMDKESRYQPKAFFSPVMLLLILLIGGANFGLNLVVVILATLMDGAIVYPVIQGGGPIISSIASRLFLGEKIPPKKAAAILLGVAAIVILNL